MPMLDPLLPLAPALDPLLDPPTLGVTRALVGWLGAPPFRHARARARERVLHDVLGRHAAEAKALGPRVRRGDAAALERFDALVAAALEEMRGPAEHRLAESAFERVAHSIDRSTFADREEWMDDPSLDERLRVRTLDRLDRLNVALGSYDAFFAAIEPAVERARAITERPTVVDLASGHGMFAVALAERFAGRIRVIATDLEPRYLEIGRARAAQRGLSEEHIAFVQQDALDLSGLSAKVDGPVDVVTCTQTLHHFRPGMVARMFAEACATARIGAVFVDGERNATVLFPMAMLSAMVGRFGIPFVHDTFVSVRRMFTEQELALLGLLAPEVGPIERGFLLPGHVFVRGRRA